MAQWDPSLTSSRLLGCCFENQTVVNVVRLTYQHFTEVLLSALIPTRSVTLSRGTWRNEGTTEAVIFMKTASSLSDLPKVSEQISVSVFAYRLRVIDGKSCLLTHVLDQHAQGLAGAGNFAIQRTLSRDQVSRRMEGLLGAFHTDSQLDSFMLAERIRETDALMLHLVPGFKAFRGAPAVGATTKVTAAALPSAVPAPSSLLSLISGFATSSLTPSAFIPFATTDPASTTNASTRQLSPPGTPVESFEAPDPKALVEVLIPNRGRGLILISQGKDSVKIFSGELNKEGWQQSQEVE